MAERSPFPRSSPSPRVYGPLPKTRHSLCGQDIMALLGKRALNKLTYFILLLMPSSAFEYLPQQPVVYSAFDYVNTAYSTRLADITTVPHHVLVIFLRLYCSGALIGSRTVLSTASCLTKRPVTDKYVVKVGSNAITEPSQLIEVLEIKIHEYYKRLSVVDNDIALLVLKHNVIFAPKVMKAILVRPSTTVRLGTYILVSGWGSKDLPSKFYKKLIFTEMSVISKEECLLYYKSVLTPSMFCARFQEGRHLSDCGGPAMFMQFLVGLVSFGATNTKPPFIAVFTNVSYFYRWIEINTRQLLRKHCIQSYSDDSWEAFEYGAFGKN